MQEQTSRARDQLPSGGLDADFAWAVVRAAAGIASRLAQTDQLAAFTLGDDAQLRMVPTNSPDALVVWCPGRGWQMALPPADPRHALIDLYLPICSATAAR